ncbi:MAG: leucine-rich repeat domain-containing protein [Bacteroidaceae bacterium]|nr:leucine-rich repeat domain-containing protein [Bacteroidaceae bacterium]
MGKIFRLNILLFAVLVSVNVSARVITSQEYNGYIYNNGYVCDFMVDSIYYTIQDEGVYVSAEKYLYDLEKEASISAPSEIILNSSYHGNITIPETVMFNDSVYDVVGIDMVAFKDCKDLLSVTISDNVKVICESAFSGCSNLKTVKFPTSWFTIEKEAFKDCVSLESVSFPDNLSYIRESSFRNCINLKSVFFPNCCMDGIEEYAFAGCTGLNYINIPSNFSSYFKPTAFDGCIIDSVYWNSIYISPLCLLGNKENCIMKHVYVDDARDYIYPGMFIFCIFHSVTISPNIKYIDEYAFKHCNNLKKIVWEGSTEIHNGAFMDCDNIDTIVIESSRAPSAIDMTYGQPILDYFSPQVYENATLIIPTGSMDEYMSSPLWSRFSLVKEIDFDEHESDLGNDSIFYYVHEDGDTIYYVVHEDGIHVVSKSFKSIGSGKTHGFDDPLTPRDPMAGGLQPRFGTRSGSDETYDTLDFKTYSGNVVIPESVPYKESINTVTCIDKYAFAGSRELVSVSLPESVRQLVYGCFAGCIGLTEITIPKSVRVIDEYAFAYCTGLKRVVIEGNPEIAATAFIGCGADLEIIVTKVESVEVMDSDLKQNGAVHYGIDGRIIPADAPGLHLIKHKDGTVSKSLVR